MKVKWFLTGLIASCVVCMLSSCASPANAMRTTVKVALPYEDRLFGINEDYYKQWLEERTELSIEFVFMPQTYTTEYMKMLFAGTDSSIDALFFSEENVPTEDELASYGAQGKIEGLGTYIDSGNTHLSQVIASHTDYDLRQAMAAPDGEIYYMPALHTSMTTKIFQTLWMNTKWLEDTGLSIPTTTDEFAIVLEAMSQKHPDGVSIIGSPQRDSTYVAHFLMNSFSVCDPKNSYMAVDKGAVYFPPQTTQWREGLRYCHMLFEKGLIPMQNFTYSEDQMKSLCNDPENLVGSFCAKNISNILNEQSPELISRYLSVPPLTGPAQAGIAISETPMPRPGGIILSSSQNKEAVFRLMDVMCSEEAFLIGHYGEEGVDWDKAEVGDISIDGSPAVIALKNQATLQRSDYASGVTGPFVTRTEYADKMAWKGMSINQSEYLKIRVFRTYQPHAQTEYIKTILFSEDIAKREEMRTALADYVKTAMTAFIIGDWDIEDDAAWKAYLDGFEQYEVTALMDLVQRIYQNMEVE